MERLIYTNGFLSLGDVKMIGPAIATVKLGGIKSPMYRLTVPKTLIDEGKIENRDQVRIWIEKIGVKAPLRKNAFGKYNKEVVGETPTTETTEVDQETIDKMLYLSSHGKSLEEIKSMIENQTDYSWNEIPEKVKKQLKA